MADIDISIATSGNPAGAKAVADAIESLKAELAKLKAELAGVAREEPKTAAAIDQLGDELTDLETKAGRAQTAVNQVATAGPAAAKGSRNMGMAVLEASRAMEDLQYGIRGVLNNIPGLIAMLGGGAGIAGAVSLLAVGLTVLAPKIAKLFDEVSRSEMEALATDLKAVGDLSAEAAIGANDLATAMEEANRRLEASETLVKKYEAALKAMLSTQAGAENAKLGADLAAIDLAEAKGQIDPATAARQRADARQAAENAKRAREQDAMNRTAAERERVAREASAAVRPTIDAEFRAGSEVDRLRKSEGMNRPELRNEADTVRRARQDLLDARRGGDPKKVEEATQAEAEAAAALKAAYDDLVSAKLDELNAAREARLAAVQRANRLAAEAVDARREAGDFGGYRAETQAAQDREAEIRREIELEKVRKQQAAEEKQRAAAQAAMERGQTSVDFAGQSMANQVGALLGQIGAAPGGAGIDPGAVAAVRAAVEQLSRDGATAGEGANLAAALDRLSQLLPARLSSYDKRLADAELAARRLEERINNLRSDPGN